MKNLLFNLFARAFKTQMIDILRRAHALGQQQAMQYHNVSSQSRRVRSKKLLKQLDI